MAAKAAELRGKVNESLTYNTQRCLLGEIQPMALPSQDVRWQNALHTVTDR